MRPRASLIPGIRDAPESAQSLFYSSKIARWLEDDHLVKNGAATDWKRRYKLRHNWSRGSARVSETRVAERPASVPLLVRLHLNAVITVDLAHGLRAWSLKDGRGLTATQSLGSVPPTCLALDTSTIEGSDIDMSVGFEDGSFAVLALTAGETAFVTRFAHPAPSKKDDRGAYLHERSISAIAYAKPYLLTQTPESSLSLYRFDGACESSTTPMEAPILLSSLKSHSAYPPSSLSIRVSATSVVASAAYAMPTWNLKWSVGVQEIRLDLNGSILDSRTASASTRFTARSLFESQSSSDVRKAISLSYTHPYLLTSHPDNTLTLYVVHSDSEELTIGSGTRLWGHTSSIAGAQVGDRGKAVSVSTVGNELRIWQLEGVMASRKFRKEREVSVQVLPGPGHRQVHDESLSLTKIRPLDESITTPGWLGFDEEKVVLLREKKQGPQALIMYDFN